MKVLTKCVMCVVTCFVAQVMHFKPEMCDSWLGSLSHSGALDASHPLGGALSLRGVTHRNQRHATRVVGPARGLWAQGKPRQVFWGCCIITDGIR